MRHAIYFTPPPGSLLHALGSSWLGRDMATGMDTAQPFEALAAPTREPARYGFHATLKAPFRLKNGARLENLVSAVQGLANQHLAVVTGPLTVRHIDGFLALVPEVPLQTLHDLADDCVAKLDDFRSVPDAQELDRRRAAGLTDRQENNLTLWGYPHVFDDFRFHMTLTNRLDSNIALEMEAMAASHFAPVLGNPLVIDALAIVTEPEPGAAFLVNGRYALIPSSRIAA